jgi:hypothetical protein
MLSSSSSARSSNAAVIFVEEKLHVDRRRFCARLPVIVKSSPSRQKQQPLPDRIFGIVLKIDGMSSNARLLEKKLGGKLQHHKHRFEQKCTISFVPKYVSYFQGRTPSRCSHDRFSARASAWLRPVRYINSRCGSRFPCISVTHLHLEWASVYFCPMECSICLTYGIVSRKTSRAQVEYPSFLPGLVL